VMAASKRTITPSSNATAAAPSAHPVLLQLWCDFEMELKKCATSDSRKNR
jgi:hypothetical protein